MVYLYLHFLCCFFRNILVYGYMTSSCLVVWFVVFYDISTLEDCLIPYPFHIYVYIYTYIYHHHHHLVVPLARISLTVSRQFSLSFIASGRSSGLHPVSSHSCWIYVRAGRPAFARPYVRVHGSSSLLLQQCPACLTWIVFVMGGRWPYSWCLVRCCRQDLFNIARSILV